MTVEGKVAIVGANGFIGSRAVEMFHLLNLAQVRPIVRRYAGLARLARFELGSQGTALDYRVADAFDQAAMKKGFEGCAFVVHAVAGDSETILGTLAPTYHAAQAAGVKRFIYLSTASVHGQNPAPGSNENSPLNMRQPIAYNNAKVKAEQVLGQLRAQGNVETVILRPGIVLGPRAIWGAHFADALLAGEAYLMQQGRGICNSIYIDNLIHAIYLAMTAPQIDGQAFLVGDQETVTWADVYRPIATALGVDLDQLPEAIWPDTTPTWLERFDWLREAKPTQALLSRFPMRWRQAAFMGKLAIEEFFADESLWALSDTSQPEASLEMALLYSCDYKLPIQKAQNLLGYHPPVSFAEGCQRTVDWLAFAGYPIIAPGEANR